MKKRLVQLIKPIVARFPRVAMTYRYVRDTWLLYEEPKETPLGFKLIGNSAMQCGTYEPEETELVKRILANADVFINIGANIGYYCCLALHHGQQLNQVIAFEPVYPNLLYLMRNVQANDWKFPIEIYPLALSNQVGVLEIFGGGPQASLIKGWGRRRGQYVTSVPSSTLDHVLGMRCQGRRCLIVVDIEGAEQMMLEGATSFINGTPKPVWMIEIAISEHQPEGVLVNPNLCTTFRTFWSRGYEAWTADRECRLIYPDEIEQVAQGGVDPFITHNYLFIERGKKDDWLATH